MYNFTSKPKKVLANSKCNFFMRISLKKNYKHQYAVILKKMYVCVTLSKKVTFFVLNLETVINLGAYEFDGHSNLISKNTSHPLTSHPSFPVQGILPSRPVLFVNASQDGRHNSLSSKVLAFYQNHFYCTYMCYR